ncbi:unnamed protein product [Amoebophrya sp. A120]|nr:unnamed protein product [Amoebophrya sp. A120]|eukprot:GSA120T00024874001.1
MMNNKGKCKNRKRAQRQSITLLQEAQFDKFILPLVQNQAASSGGHPATPLFSNWTEFLHLLNTSEADRRKKEQETLPQTEGQAARARAEQSRTTTLLPQESEPDKNIKPDKNREPDSESEDAINAEPESDGVDGDPFLKENLFKENKHGLWTAMPEWAANDPHVQRILEAVRGPEEHLSFPCKRAFVAGVNVTGDDLEAVHARRKQIIVALSAGLDFPQKNAKENAPSVVSLGNNLALNQQTAQAKRSTAVSADHPSGRASSPDSTEAKDTSSAPAEAVEERTAGEQESDHRYYADSSVKQHLLSTVVDDVVRANPRRITKEYAVIQQEGEAASDGVLSVDFAHAAYLTDRQYLALALQRAEDVQVFLARVETYAALFQQVLHDKIHHFQRLASYCESQVRSIGRCTGRSSIWAAWSNKSNIRWIPNPHSKKSEKEQYGAYFLGSFAGAGVDHVLRRLAKSGFFPELAFSVTNMGGHAVAEGKAECVRSGPLEERRSSQFKKNLPSRILWRARQGEETKRWSLSLSVEDTLHCALSQKAAAELREFQVQSGKKILHHCGLSKELIEGKWFRFADHFTNPLSLPASDQGTWAPPAGARISSRDLIMEDETLKPPAAFAEPVLWTAQNGDTQEQWHNAFNFAGTMSPLHVFRRTHRIARVASRFAPDAQKNDCFSRLRTPEEFSFAFVTSFSQDLTSLRAGLGPYSGITDIGLTNHSAVGKDRVSMKRRGCPLDLFLFADSLDHRKWSGTSDEENRKIQLRTTVKYDITKVQPADPLQDRWGVILHIERHGPPDQDQDAPNVLQEQATTRYYLETEAEVDEFLVELNAICKIGAEARAQAVKDIIALGTEAMTVPYEHAFTLSSDRGPYVPFGLTHFRIEELDNIGEENSAASEDDRVGNEAADGLVEEECNSQQNEPQDEEGNSSDRGTDDHNSADNMIGLEKLGFPTWLELMKLTFSHRFQQSRSAEPVPARAPIQISCSFAVRGWSAS